MDFLKGLKNEINDMVIFGFWSGNEPKSILHTLDAKSVMVIEKNWSYIERFRQNYKHENKIGFICADMTSDIPALKPENYDLAFCRNVLYQLINSDEITQAENVLGGEYRRKDGLDAQLYINLKVAVQQAFRNDNSALKQGIHQMSKGIKQGGYIIAVESQLFNYELNKDIEEIFLSEGLKPFTLDDAPSYTFSYQKI